jgi:hypothetical protein
VGTPQRFPLTSALGWNYFIIWFCVLANEYNVLTSIFSVWTTKVPQWGFFLIFWVSLSAVPRQARARGRVCARARSALDAWEARSHVVGAVIRPHGRWSRPLACQANRGCQHGRVATPSGPRAGGSFRGTNLALHIASSPGRSGIPRLSARRSTVPCCCACFARYRHRGWQAARSVTRSGLADALWSRCR